MDWSLYGFEGLTEILNVHPAFVHFPIALFPAALLFFGLGLALRREPFLIAGRSCLYLAVLSVAVVVYTGLQAKQTFPMDEHMHRMVETHEHTGFIIAGLSFALIAWDLASRGNLPRFPWAFTALLAVASYFVLQNGDIGSRMVYLHGAAVEPVVQAQESESGRKGGGSQEGHGHPAGGHVQAGSGSK